MKGCAHIREQLSAMLDGMLSPDEIKAVGEHLAICPSCAAAHEELRKVVTHLHALEQVEPPPWMAQKVMARVRSLETAPEKKGFLSRLFKPADFNVPVGALATIVLSVAIYFLFEGIIQDMTVNRTETPPDSPKQVAKEPVPAPEKAAARTSPAKTQTAAMAPLKQRSVDYESGVKARVENRLWQEDTAKTRSAIPSPRAARGGDGFEPVAPASMPEGDSYPRAKSSRSYVAEKRPVLFHVIAADPAAAATRIITAMNEFRGGNIKKDIVGNKTVVRGELNAVWLDRFFDRLRDSGPVLEKNAPAFAHANTVVVTVEIVSGK